MRKIMRAISLALAVLLCAGQFGAAAFASEEPAPDAGETLFEQTSEEPPAAAEEPLLEEESAEPAETAEEEAADRPIEPDEPDELTEPTGPDEPIEPETEPSGTTPDASGETAPPDGFSTVADASSEEPALALDGGGEDGVFTVSDTITATLEDGVLTVFGTGAMPDFGASSMPWAARRSEITKLVVGDGVTSIGSLAMNSCGNLKEIALSDTVASIGSGAFYDCTALTEVVLPASVKALGSGCFANCYDLARIEAPGAAEIGVYAFQQTAITEFTVPAGCTSLDGGAFWETDLAALRVAEGNDVYSAADGVLFTDGGETLVLYPRAKPDESYTVPASVTRIGDMAFANTLYLAHVDLGGVTALGDSAFQNCESLKEAVLPDSVTEAGNFAFYGCPALVSVRLGNGMKTIESYQMFRACTALREIDFGGAETLGAHMFAYCSSLESVTLPATVKELGSGCFGECYALTSLRTEGLTLIPWEAFMNCRNLRDVTLNEGLSVIQRGAFYGCSSLRQITLPASVRYVHSVAFPADTAITCGDPLMEPYGRNGYCRQEHVTVAGTFDYAAAFEVLALVNEARAGAGLDPLVMNFALLETAMTRAAESSILFSHTRPNGSTCFTASSLLYGENLAFGSATAAGVMDQWMNSQGHRANILTEDFTTIGVGCFVIGGQRYWAQCFGVGPAGTDCGKPLNTEVERTIDIAVDRFPEADDSVGLIWGEPTSYAYELRIGVTATTLSAGEQEELVCAIVNPGAGLTRISTDSVLWSTSDPLVATVENGVVTAVGGGTAEITARTRNGGFTKTVTFTVEGEPAVRRGDADGDGAPDAYDAALILQYAAGILGPDGLDTTAADVDGDGLVDARDAAAILS